MTALYLIETRVGLQLNGEASPTLGPAWAATREQARAVAEHHVRLVGSALVGANVAHRVYQGNVRVLETWAIWYGSANFTVVLSSLPCGLDDITYPYWEYP